MTQPASRPAAAYAVPIALAILGALDVAVALMPRSDDPSIPGMLATMSFMVVALAGALQLTCAALIAMRRWLGRALYLYGMPVTFVLGGAVSYLQIAVQAPTPESLQRNLSTVGLGLLLSVLLYAALAYALTRRRMATWLAAAHEAGAAEADAPPARQSPFVSLIIRVALFAALLAVMVLVLGAPPEVLYVGAAVVAVMIAIRLGLWRRLAKPDRNDGNQA